MHCTTPESPTSKGTKLHDPISYQQSLRMAGSDEPTACDPLPNSCATKKHAEIDRPLDQASIVEQVRNGSKVEGSGQTNEPSKSLSNDAQLEERCLRKRGASHTPASTKSEGATDEAGEGKGAAYARSDMVDCSSSLQPRPIKFPRSTQEPMTSQEVVTEAAATTGGFSTMPEKTHQTDTAKGVLKKGVTGGIPTEQRQGGSISHSEMYQSAWILAPMVRISTLPFRLECLKYGAGKVGNVISVKCRRTHPYPRGGAWGIVYTGLLGCARDRPCLL